MEFLELFFDIPNLKYIFAEIISNMSEEKSSLSEMQIGLVVAFFGAILAIAGIGGGKFDGDQFVSASEATKAYSWYQSKSIKNTSLEAQRDLLIALTKSGAINQEYSTGVDSFIKNLETKSQKYKKEMREILEGSAKVGKENWVQEKNGKLGNIIGAQEWEDKTNYLDEVGNWFDLTNLFLNLCLLLGAICLVIQEDKTRKLFFYTMLILGIIGTLINCYAFYLGFSAP